jgi:hypothetical protein
MTPPKYWFVFDVESVGLHGEGFAVGYVVYDADRNEEAESGSCYCDPIKAHGSDEGRAWIKENVRIDLSSTFKSTPYEVRQWFWDQWKRWKTWGAIMAADVAWPVEARFLSACIDDVNGRDWEGPYPLIDIASIRLAAGLDPLETCPRLDEELPAHNARSDARQSARLLMEALAILEPTP